MTTDDVPDCLFCDPARSRLLCESASWYVRFDNYPATPGHVEAVPRRHVASWRDLDPHELHEGITLLNEAAALLADEHHPDGWNLGINDGPAAGQTIAHLHIHLIPRHWGDQPDPRAGIRRGLPNGDPDAWITPDGSLDPNPECTIRMSA